MSSRYSTLSVSDEVFQDSKVKCPIMIDPARTIIEAGKRKKIKITFLPPRCNSLLLSPIVQEKKKTDADTSTSIEKDTVSGESAIMEPPSAFKKEVLVTVGGSHIIAKWTIIGFVKKKKKPRGLSKSSKSSDGRGLELLSTPTAKSWTTEKTNQSKPKPLTTKKVEIKT